MDSGYSPQPVSQAKCCNCGCSSCNGSFSETCPRSVKRKYDESVEENKFTVPGLVVPQIARVEIENECNALRETVCSQQQTIQELIMELEEERNASASAANEAMSMILRLQSEKAEVQMEARQFKRFVEEKMEHDQQETMALEDLLYKREQTIHSLTCEVQAFRHRMMSYGVVESEYGGEKGMSRNTSIAESLDGQYVFPPYEIYPSLKCNTNESQAYPDGDDETADIEKYPFGETPRSSDQLKDLEYRINELEQTPRTLQTDGDYFGTQSMLEKVVGQSPSRPNHIKKEISPDSQRFGGSVKKTVFSNLDVNPNYEVNNASENGDDMSDRVYTIDSVHQVPPVVGVANHKASVGSISDDYTKSPRDPLIHSDMKDLEVQKLYARLQALEADRESMRQALISVGTDKAQLVLLKEIAQNLCKEMAPARAAPVQKKSLTKSLSFISLFKWVISFVLWRRKARRSRYTFGMSAKNEGLLMLLDRGPRIGHRRIAPTVNLRH